MAHTWARFVASQTLTNQTAGALLMDHDADLCGSLGAIAPFVSDQCVEAAETVAFFRVAAPSKPPYAVPAAAAASPLSLDSYVEGQENERLRMSRELHDSTSQLLLALRLSVAHLRHERDTGNMEEILSEIDDTARQIDQEIRTFSFLNYPVELGNYGLIGALETLAKGFGMRTGIHIGFRNGCKQPCFGRLAFALLRVAQEALMNVHRHAHATAVRVTLLEHDGVLELSVRDDGRGMPPADHHAVVNGVGLQGMRHRIERLGGRFSIRRLKQGTKLVASAPRIRPSTLRAA